MDPPRSPTNAQSSSIENPSFETTAHGDSLYNHENNIDFYGGTLKHLNHLPVEEGLGGTTAPVYMFESLLNDFDPLPLHTNPGPPSTDQSDRDNSLYNSETYDFSTTASEYLNDILMEGELEETTVNGFSAPVYKYINVTEGVPVNEFDPPPSTDPFLSLAVLGSGEGESLQQNSPLFPSVSKYKNGMLMERDLEDASVNFKDGTPADGIFPTNPSSSFLLGTNGEITSNDSETSDFSYAVLNYINDMSMEGDLEDNPCMLQDSLALQAAEKSLYDILVENYPTSPHWITEIPGENCVPFTSVDSCNSCNCNSADDLVKSNWISYQQDLEWSESILSTKEINEITFPEQFNRMLENADKRILRGHMELEEEVSQCTASQSKGRKNHEREDNGCFEEGRSNKYSLASTEESKHLEMLDDGFLLKVENKELPCPLHDTLRNEASKKFWQEQKLLASIKRVKKLEISSEKVDLLSLLIECAQAVGRADQGGAAEILKQIRQHSSPHGDASQRSAHFFAIGLEARLFGSVNMFQVPLPGQLATTVDILKAFQLYVSICPFRRISNFWTNRMIAKEAQNKTRIHIIDFGIGYGFQWSCFLNRLSRRPGGPPRIRITGIDFPQPGFRPAERVEDTGRRLKRLAEALNVPFEYKAIAHKWECIRYEDLNIDQDEMIAVTCMNRLRHLPDDIMVLDSARDAVLKLIRKINPEVFVHGIVNGSFNASFFTTRFREALFHFSAMFDMLEATTPREDQERLLFEREMIGKDVMNVIACEGFERIERPETYKQWQSRNCRNGFVQLPLDSDITRRARVIKNNYYHRDFTVDEDGKWMLMGWKGRIMQALSAWKPVHN